MSLVIHFLCGLGVLAVGTCAVMSLALLLQKCWQAALVFVVFVVIGLSFMIGELMFKVLAH